VIGSRWVTLSSWIPWRRPSIRIGGQRVKVKPIGLENALRLALLLAPHLARIEDHWPEVKAALETTDGTRPDLLTAVFMGLREELSEMPGDMVKALALLLDMQPVQLADKITAQEFIKALPVLDEVNDLMGLYTSLRALGLMARYQEGTNGK